jgi:hypothetical protein
MGFLQENYHDSMQSVPRINSSAQYKRILESEFPSGCNHTDGSFYVNYTNINEIDTHDEYAMGT